MLIVIQCHYKLILHNKLDLSQNKLLIVGIVLYYTGNKNGLFFQNAFTKSQWVTTHGTRFLYKKLIVLWSTKTVCPSLKK